MKKILLYSGFLAIFLGNFCTWSLLGNQKGPQIPQDILYWDWNSININQPHFLETLAFPAGFEWGVADSAYQVEGSYYYNDRVASNNWTEWEAIPGKIKEGQTVGRSCDRWNRYKEDIALIKACGFKTYRFSIEWSKIEPEKGVFDPIAMQHYIDVVDELLANGINPVVCLFHHTWPTWFGDEDGWEKPENIRYFVEFALYVFEHLHTKVHTWMTINEPAGYAMSGFSEGNVPPGKKDLLLCGKVLKNFLDAHIACYKAMKSINATVEIGFPHVIALIDPYHPDSKVERYLAEKFSYLVNTVTLMYFKTGHFNWTYPGFLELITQKKLNLWTMLKNTSFTVSYTDYNPEAPQCLDYIGVNYYFHTNICIDLINFKFGPHARADKNEISSSMGFTIYPEGMYRAIAECSILGIPMDVAENGVADNDDTLKQSFIKSHLYAVSKAIQDSYNVRSYYYWTLMDNWEWDKGYTQKFGLFAVDRQTQERTLYPGAQEFIEFVQKQKQNR